MIKFHIKGVKTYVSKGRRYYYDRVSNQRIHAPYGTTEFAMEVQALRDAHAKERVAIKKGTLGSLILDYFASLEFQGLADRTKADRRRYAKDLDKLRGLVLAELTTPDITAIRDKMARKYTKDRANRLKNFLHLLFKWGKPHGHIKHNPAADVPNLKKSRTEKAKVANRPWTATELENFLAHTYPEMRVAVALAAWTSLREQDIIKVPWSALNDGWITWNHNKTGAAFDCPISAPLWAILQDTPRQAVTIVTGRRGNSYTATDGFRTNFGKERDRLEEAGLIEEGCTFHGLRHTILTAAAEEGATTAEIMSISGHKTEAQVRRYTATAKRKKSAQKVISALENKNKK